MDQSEKQLIEGLFSRLQQAESQSGPRDPEAESQIRKALNQQPTAPYYMAQAILVQEHVLEQLNQRVAQLEQELSQRPAGGGSFLGGLFGAGNQPNTASSPPPRASMSPPPATGRSGFMGSAMQTAAAVAGGVLVGNMLAGMFAGGAAEAAEPPADDGTGFEDTGSYGQDDPGDFGDDFGGFDDLGDF